MQELVERGWQYGRSEADGLSLGSKLSHLT